MAFPVSPARREAIERLARELRAGPSTEGGRPRTVALSTHVNSDGDGCGSEIALAHMLRQMGLSATIVNPTPWPEMFDFLRGDIPILDPKEGGVEAMTSADVAVVLDISDVKRLSRLADAIRARTGPTLVIDHHQPSEDPPGSIMLSDTSACATGELVYDFGHALGLEMTPSIADALYVAILTDTGSFRYSNTTPRCHRIAAELLEIGVDPEAMYQRIYASMPLGRLRLLRDALSTLEADTEHGITWISVPAGAIAAYDIRPEDFDGIAEHARSVAGTRMAIFFRQLESGNRIKVSIRTTGTADANAFAKLFGGGGHVKAAGALIDGSLEDVQRRVVDAARAFLDAAPTT